MSQQQLSAKQQQGNQILSRLNCEQPLKNLAELQTQYSNYKENLQAIAQKIGEVEQEAEEHK